MSEAAVCSLGGKPWQIIVLECEKRKYVPIIIYQ